MILAIDTATRSAGLALLDPEREILRAEHFWRSHINHTVELAPSLQEMLHRQALSTRALSGIAVARGPGSFTGLRIGMSLAKALAYAHGIAIVSIPTPDILAYTLTRRDLPLCVVLEAGRGNIVVAHYPVGVTEAPATDYRIMTVPELAQTISEKTLFAGELDRDAIEQLRTLLGPRAVIATPAARVRRPAALAEAGWSKLKAGQVEDPASLTPIYLHRPA